MISGKAPVVSRKNIISTITDRVFSISKAKEELHYSPFMKLAIGIRETVGWYRKTKLV